MKNFFTKCPRSLYLPLLSELYRKLTEYKAGGQTIPAAHIDVQSKTLEKDVAKIKKKLL